jgi:hypothetical protein
MAVLVVAVATVVATLGIILFAVHKTRPRLLRLTVSLTRWLSLSLEIESPERSNRRWPDHARGRPVAEENTRSSRSLG